MATPMVTLGRFPVQLSAKISHTLILYCHFLTLRSTDVLSTQSCYFSVRRKTKKGHKSQLKSISQFWNLNVVCAGEDFTSNTLLLRTHNAGYLFNCGETTQRFLLNNNLAGSFNLINNIFLTSTSYRNIAGILGYLLSTRWRDPKGRFIIHGHPSNENVFKVLQLFTEIRLLSILNAEWRTPIDETYEDDHVFVEYVKLFPTSTSSKLSNANGSVGGATREDDEDYTVAYIVRRKTCTNHSKKQDNSCNGSYMDQLDTDDTGQSKDSSVKRGNIPGSFLVIECPSEEYLDSLLSSEQLNRIAEDKKKQMSLVVHMSNASVIADQRYQEFMSRFSGDVYHLMMNQHCPGSYIKTQHRLQRILNMLHPTTFPKLTSHTEFDSPPSISEGHTIQAFNGLRFNPDSSQPFSIIEGLYKQFDVARVSDKVSPSLQKLLRESSAKEQVDYPEVTFLGTSSGITNWARNQSGILVQTREDEYILLDCGEGSLLQLHQLYGSQTEQVLANLRAVFISHLHYDHIGGLSGLISARAEAMRKLGHSDRLCIIAPKVFVRWVSYYERYFGELSSKVRVFAHENIKFQNMVGSQDKQLEGLKDLISVNEIVPVSVTHTETAHGIVLVHKDGWKLVFSGDCRPTEDLIENGKGCDILIHEGTYPDRQARRACIRKHSTTKEAIEVSEKMEAKFTILTHISSTNVIQEESYFSKQDYEHIAFAYDCMKVRRSSMEYIPTLKKAILQVFHGQNTKRL